MERVEERQLELNDTVLQGPGLILNGPGVILNGPGVILNGPGIILNGPGVILNGPGVILNGPGVILNGPGLVLNSIEFNGPGVVLNGPGVVLNGPGVILNGTSFSASVTKDGVTYQLSGFDFIGAEFDLRVTAMVNGELLVQEIILRIDNIVQSAEQADVLLYDLTYRPKAAVEWQHYCGQAGVSAVPLKNSWNVETGDRIDDENAVTFACTNAVLAKCTLWGYRPWATAKTCGPLDKKTKKQTCTTISLQDHHQACTRMARADYCGDGTPRTVDGTLIDIWDRLSPPLQTRFTDWPLEAEWTPEGANCMNFQRHPEFSYPSCFMKKKKKVGQCGKTPLAGSLTFNGFDAP